MRLTRLTVPLAVVAMTGVVALPALAQGRGGADRGGRGSARQEVRQRDVREPRGQSQPRSEARPRYDTNRNVDRRPNVVPRGPSYSTPRAPSYSTPRAPGYSTPRAPGYSTPRTPNYLAPRVPNRVTPRAPSYVPPRSPYSAVPRAPHYVAPRAPAYRQPYRSSYRPYFFQRPYYSFRPRLNIGLSLLLGFPITYPHSYLGSYVPHVYGLPRTSVGVTLGPGSYGGISFEIEPSNAAVFVDGEYVGEASDFTPYAAPLTLAPGLHRIEIQAEGYRPLAWEVQVLPGQVLPYRGTLEYWEQ